MDWPHGTPFPKPPDPRLSVPPAVVGRDWTPALTCPLSWEPGVTVVQKVPEFWVCFDLKTAFLR